VNFTFGQPKPGKYLSDGQVKWKKNVNCKYTIERKMCA